MNKQQRLNQLNQFNEGYRLTEAEIVAEYQRMYKSEPTPWTNPEIFDPLNPPQGWEYDAWHAIWYKTPTEAQVQVDLFIVRAAFVLSAVISSYIVFKTYFA